MRLIKFTKEGLEELKNEVRRLEEARPDAVRELSRAREMGDLSENGLYTAAKGRLRSMDSQIRRLSNQIKLATVVATKKVLVERDGRKVEYEIVGDFEANPHENKISQNSPIGRALNNAKAGETVEIETPGGKIILKIIKVI